MNIRHESIRVNGENKIYIFVDVEDKYEFGEELLKPGESTSFIEKLKAYLNQKVEFNEKDTATLIVNGVLIGAISLGVFANAASQMKETATPSSEISYQVAAKYLNKAEQDKAAALAQTNENNSATNNGSLVAEAVLTTPAPTPTAAVVTPAPTTPKVVTAPKVTKPAPTPVSTAPTGYTVKVSTNGNVVTMNLEDYVVGVVASEVQPTFQMEALKSQAIVARTFAMKKTSQGAVLINSTTNQTYKSDEQLQKQWGSSYNTYINRIRTAVNDTHGMVLTYNGQYIDAQYFAISNSKTEMPKYVWGSNVPYLQSVSSNWDTGVKGFEVSTNISYSTLTTKLGQPIDKNTEFTILSKTISDRVDTIKIGNTTYTGAKLRSILGLRSTDFSIVKGDTGITLTTKGLGHGVGMSQNGANEAAKQGYTYDQILKHYYTGVAIVRK